VNEVLAFAVGVIAAALAAWQIVRTHARRAARTKARQRAQNAEVLAAVRERERRQAAGLAAEVERLRAELASPQLPPPAIPAAPAAEAPAPPAASLPGAPPLGGDISAQAFAVAMGRELADIVSGIEGGSYQLMESANHPAARGAAAENLWLAVRRVRHFHDKLAAFVSAPVAEAQATGVESLLIALREEVQQSALGLQLGWSLPRTLPPLIGSHEALLDALLFCCHALLQLERGALRLSINVEPCFEDDTPHVELELQLEYDEDPARVPPAEQPAAAFTIACAAATNVVERHGGTLVFEHEPGEVARALARLPAAEAAPAHPPALASLAAGPPASTADAPAVAAAPVLPRPPRHDYGGVLVLESDPTVRSMLASELKAWGRSVFACADGAAVRSLLQATPGRFEMLVVDRAARLDAGDASTALRLCPQLKVFVLSGPDDEPAGSELVARAHRIRKPFGVQELRRALADVLAG
jgi:CheY-like chemotaxis protein